MSIDFQRIFSEKAGSHDDLIKVIKISHNFSLMFGNECIEQALGTLSVDLNHQLAFFGAKRFSKVSLTIIRRTALLG